MQQDHRDVESFGLPNIILPPELSLPLAGYDKAG